MSRRRGLRRRIPTPDAVDHPRWMGAISSLTEEQVDDLLAGRAPDGHRDLEPVADVATAVSRCAADEPAPIMRYPLRQAVARSMAPAEPARTGSLVHAALSGAAIAVLAVAGAANALPAPVQDAVANVTHLVGVDVPKASDEQAAPPGDVAPQATAAPVTEAEDEGTEAKAVRPPSTPLGATSAEEPPPDQGTLDAVEAAPPDTPPGDSEEPAGAPVADDGDDSVTARPTTGDDRAAAGGDNANDPRTDGEEGEDDDEDHGSPADGRVPRVLPPATPVDLNEG